MISYRFGYAYSMEYTISMLTNKEGIMVLFFISIFLVLKINCQITTQLWKTRYFSQENWQNGFLKTQILLSTGDIGFMECQIQCLKKGHLCDSFHFEKLTGDCVLGQDAVFYPPPNLALSKQKKLVFEEHVVSKYLSRFGQKATTLNALSFLSLV